MTNYDINKVFAERLNEAIKACCTYNAALANRVGCSKCAVAGWRRGQNMPDGYNVARLAMALGVSADWLLGLTDINEEE